MVDLVKIEGSIEEIEELLGRASNKPSRSSSKSSSKAKEPKKSKSRPRTLSAYQKFLKSELPKLRKKHPRMKQPQLMKKAAAAWRKKKRG